LKAKQKGTLQNRHGPSGPELDGFVALPAMPGLPADARRLLAEDEEEVRFPPSVWEPPEWSKRTMCFAAFLHFFANAFSV
jgi:hypothetical protein